MATPHWDDDPETWDTLVLGTQTMPGIWDVEDGNVKRVLEVKKAPGRDGATIKDQGYENGALVLRGQLLDPEDWETMQTIATSLKLATKGKARTPLAIGHPKAAYLGVQRVYVNEIEVPRIDNGIMTLSIRVLEYVDKPKGTGKKTVKTSENLEGVLARNFSGDFKGKNAVTAAPVVKQLDAKRARQLDQANADFRADQASGKTPKFSSDPGKAPRYGRYTVLN